MTEILREEIERLLRIERAARALAYYLPKDRGERVLTHYDPEVVELHAALSSQSVDKHKATG